MNRHPSINVRKLAAEIADLKKLVRSRTPQLGLSSIEDGTIAEYDATGQLVQVIGTQFDGTHTAASVSGPNPPQPSRAYSLGSPGGFTVQWDGLFENPDDVAPMDFLRLDVIEDVDSEVDPIAKPPTASISSPRGGTVFIATTDQVTRYVYLVVRSESGKASLPSFGVAVDPIASGGSDGDAPADAPTASAQPFAIRSGWVAWDKPDNGDPLTYRVYLKDAPGVDPAVDELAAETDSLYAVVDRYGGELLDPTITYYAVVVPLDADGVGPASAEVSFTPRQADNDDISADFAYFGEVQARQIASGVSSADIAIAGSYYVASIDEDTGLPIENTVRWIVDGEGAQRAYRLSDGKEMLTIDPATGSFVWRGDGEFDHATFINGTIQGGENEIAEGGALILQKGVTTPKNGPSVSVEYDSVQFALPTNADMSSLVKIGSSWYSAYVRFPNQVRICEFAADGSLVRDVYTGMGSSEVWGITTDGTYIYCFSNSRIVARIDPATLLLSGLTAFWPHMDGDRRPAIGYDPVAGEIIIAQSRATDDRVRFRRYTYAGGGSLPNSATGPVDSSITFAHDLGSVDYGLFDLGHARYLMHAYGNGNYRSIQTNGVNDTADEWPATAAVVGTWWDGTNFYSLDTSGVLRKYEAGAGNRWTTDTDENWFVSYTWYQATNGYETLRSPYASVTMKKRAKLRVQTAPIPGGSSNPPSEARVYLKKGTTSPGSTATTVNMRRQATSATGDPPTLTVVDADFGTANNPSAGGFPVTGAPATIKGSDLSTLVSANDTGDQAFTPVLTASVTNPTGYTATGRFRIDGDKWVRIEYDITFPAAASMGSGQLILSVPPGMTLATPFELFLFGLRDVSTNDTYAAYAMVDTDGQHLRMQLPPDPAGTTQKNANLNPAGTFTIAAGDKLVGIINARKA